MGIYSHYQKINRAAISVSSGTTATLIAGTTGKKIRVLSLALTTDVTGTVVFNTNVTALSGVMDLVAGQPFVLPNTDLGWLDTVAGDALNVTTSQAIHGFVNYILLP